MPTPSIARYPFWLWCLFVGMLALGTDEFVISGILHDVARDLDVSPGTAGLLVTAFALAFALGTPVLAFLTDRADKKTVLTTALLIFALANAAVAVSDDFVLIAVVSALVAGLSALLAPSVPGGPVTGIGARMAPVRNPRVLALVTAMFLSGAGGLMFYSYLGTIFTQQLGTGSGDVTLALLVVGVVGLVAVFFGGFLSDGLGPRPARFTVLGGHCVALGLLATYLGAGGGGGLPLFLLVAFWSVFAWALSPVMQAGIMGVSTDQPMLAMSLGISGLYGGSAVGAALGGYLVDHHGPGAVPLVGTSWLAIAVLCAAVRAKPTGVGMDAPVSTMRKSRA